MTQLPILTSGSVGVDPKTAGLGGTAEVGQSQGSSIARGALLLALALPVTSLTLVGFDSLRRVGLGLVSLLLLAAAWTRFRGGRTGWTVGFVVLVCWLIFSALRARNPQFGAESGLVVVGGMLLAWGVWALPGMKDDVLRLAPTILSWLAIPIVLVGWLQNFRVPLGPWFDSISEVPASLFGESNLGGIWCALSIPWLIAEIVRQGPARITATAGLAGLAGYQLISKSRASFLALGIGWVVALALYIARTRRERRREASLSVLALPAMALMVGYGAGFSLLNWKSRGEFLQDLASTYSINLRMEHWGSTARMWKESPLLGVGLGNFQADYHRHRSDAEVRHLGVVPGKPERFRMLTGSHQTWLQLGAEAGVLAILGCLGFLVGGLVVWLKGSRGVSLDQFHVGVAATATVVAGLVAGMFNSLHVAPAHWALLGLSSGLLWVLGSGSEFPSNVPGPWQRTLMACGMVLGLVCIFLLVRKVQGRWDLHWTNRRSATPERLESIVAKNPYALEGRMAAAQAWLRVERPERSRPHLEAMVRWEPDNPAVRYWFGRMELMAGRPQAATAHLDQAVARAGDWAAPHFGLGLVSASTGDWNRAVHSYRSAIDRDPSWSEAHDELSKAFRAMGEYAEADRHAAEARRLVSLGNSGSQLGR